MDLRETGSKHRHPWELSRSDSVLKMCKPYIGCDQKVAADIGCGDLYFTNLLREAFNGKIYAVDTGFAQADLSLGDERIIKLCNIAQLQDNSIDIAILMDVLEHIEEPDEVLSLLHSKMRRDGETIITVPAFQHLRSEHDVFLKHYRRYTKKCLTATLSTNGFCVDKIFYFYSSLYIFRFLQLMISKLRKRTYTAISYNRDTNSAMTRFIRNALNLDFGINKKLGMLSFFGLSIFAKCSMRED